MRQVYCLLLVVVLFAQACAVQQKPAPLTEAEIHAIAAIVMASVLDFEQEARQRLDNLDERVKALETKPTQPPDGGERPEDAPKLPDEPPRPANPEPSPPAGSEQREDRIAPPHGQGFQTANRPAHLPAIGRRNQLRVVIGNYGVVDVEREPQVGDAFELPAGRFVVIATEPLQFRMESRTEASVVRSSDSVVRFNSRGYIQPAYGRYDYPPPNIWEHLAGAHGQADAYSLSRRDAELLHDSLHD